MKKLTSWMGMVVTSMSVSLVTGCSGDDPLPMNNAGGTTGTAGTGTVAGSAGTGTAGSGTAGGTQLVGFMGYTYLTGADATPGAAASPPAYTNAVCTGCHGANAEGFTNIAPEIRHLPSAYATWVVRNGREGMPAANETTLPAADLAAIITWSQSLPKPTTPEGLYKDFCGNCHGPSVPTGGLVPVSIKGVKVGELNMKVRQGVGLDPAMRGSYMPAFDMTALTDAELGLIGQFIGAVP